MSYVCVRHRTLARIQMLPSTILPSIPRSSGNPFAEYSYCGVSDDPASIHSSSLCTPPGGHLRAATPRRALDDARPPLPVRCSRLGQRSGHCSATSAPHIQPADRTAMPRQELDSKCIPEIHMEQLRVVKILSKSSLKLD
jgi:hypothetical protein